HRARELQKQAKQLQEEVERSGLGADMQPVPEPTVRDLSLPQTKATRGRKPPPTPVTEPAPADEGEVIPAHGIAGGTPADILRNQAESGNGDPKPESVAAGPSNELEKPPERPVEPETATATASSPVGSSAKSKSRKPKPITVASTPMIGNY